MEDDNLTVSELEGGLTYRRNLEADGSVDLWSFYDFKQKFRDSNLQNNIRNGAIMPFWTPWHDRRRIRAYELLDSFYKLCARRWSEDTPEQQDRREYGDPFLLVEAVTSSVLGDDPKITIEGLLPDDESAESNVASDVLKTLERWADKEMFLQKRREHERTVQKLGDGVIVLGWDEKKKRPRLRVYDPASYFPCEDPTCDDDFPEKVHIAYEFEEVNPADGKRERWLRRSTWELKEVPGYSVPWESEKQTESCFYKDMKWKLGNVRASGEVDNISDENAITITEEVDLELDFIPVIHYPNMATHGESPWGVSVLAPVVQLLDDLVATDSDLQLSSSLTGSPVIGLAGAQVPKDDQGNAKSYGPGTVFETGDGKLDMMDTSHSLDALIKMDNHLLDRMSVNARTPSTLLGRVDPGKVQAGVILTLSFAPHTTMIREMRMIRKIKDALLMKFVMRMFLKEGTISKDALKDGELPKANMTPGSFLPADKMEIGNILGVLVPAGAISLETGIQMCINAGYPIEDIAMEIKRIESRDFKGADDLFAATSSTELVLEYLNRNDPGSIVTQEEKDQATLDSQQLADELKQNPPTPPLDPNKVPPPGGGGQTPTKKLGDPTKGKSPAKGTDPTRPA